MDQESPRKERVKDCVKTKDGRISIEKVAGCAGIIIFVILGVLMSIGYLDESIKPIVNTGLLGSFGTLTGNSFGRNH